eukprot:CAMPEP_0182417352 /NCGR_PEP_ID=MMETSP1167-20130531/1798_1 /TAXON_ID=2988 /ORGANISM="Mallomonas Sp, Strain CCMP3275" /LENGTH=193 /DNA_ID=CAMNT_0024590833 /DNA_START=109 /DNA_END=690 /DNA_ORIENTATION=-
MAPKKKAPKKKENPENGGKLEPEAEAEMYKQACQSLQVQLAERTEESSRALSTKRELQNRVTQISHDYDDEQKQTFVITQDMTRQYKDMREELLSRINKLEETILELNDQLDEGDKKHDRILKEKNTAIAERDLQIQELQKKMDDMAEEFGEMLRETLEKMHERIEITSGTFDAPDLPIQQRMEELKLSMTNE